MNNDLQKRYNALKALVVRRKEEFDRLMQYLETKTEYLTAPASTRFHMSRECGLVEHTVNVGETLLRIKAQLAPQISDESCVLVALLHDLGKAGMPGEPLYLKNQPTERQRQYGYGPTWPYSFNDKLLYMSVPLRSLYLSLPYIDLTEEETQAIMYHDGQYIEDNRSVATKECPLTLLLHYADNWSAFVLEKDEK